MVGIVSLGGYIPRYRLSAKTFAAVRGTGRRRAVAGYDEDSLTMACDAALSALHGRDVRRIGARWRRAPWRILPARGPEAEPTGKS
jgi:3-hydroxy-3-methylglutaryl CoA synthase